MEKGVGITSNFRLQLVKIEQSICSVNPQHDYFSYLDNCVMKLANHLPLVLRLRMCGAIPPLPQYAFMAWYLTEQWIPLQDVLS
jgi:hypothetical protein